MRFVSTGTKNRGKCDGYYVIDASYRNRSDYELDTSFICQDEDECDTCGGNYILFSIINFLD